MTDDMIIPVKLPIDFLQAELEKFIKALDKSHTAFARGKITEETHKNHVENLQPIIAKYRNAVRVLQIYE